MKNAFLTLTACIVLISCSEEVLTSKAIKEKTVEFLPFKKVELNSLADFKETSKNWSIAGNAFVDRKQERTLIPSNGTGVLVNIPVNDNNSHIFSKFEHGDIELELDVMMPVNSNSGIYFQGRYEVQLLDSWGEKNLGSGDMGGLYKRWDETKKEEKDRGFEGRVPNINAAKAPGLWQHFKIIFHAPKFDASGVKIKNAQFEEVWLNGKLLHKNIEVSGPTRSSAFNDEVSLAPLMIQGDHGSVAFRNIKYKLYNNKKIRLNNVQMSIYEGNSKYLNPNDNLKELKTIAIDTLSAATIEGKNLNRLLKYSGELEIPVSGDYLFELRLNNGGGLLLINKDTLIDRNADFDMNEPGFGTVNFQKGKHSFSFLYNKHRPDHSGFTLQVEGPNIQKYFLNSPGSVVLKYWQNPDQIMLNSSDEIVMQRCFVLHNEKKRTHSIAVSTPEKINYSFDLEIGSLLNVWWGPFLDVTHMWFSRGGEQIALPEGIPVVMHGDQDFSILQNKNSDWPEYNVENSTIISLGYNLDKFGYPTFSLQLEESIITNKFIPSKDIRGITRIITVKGSTPIWHKIGDGEIIKKLPNGTFLINDKSYYVDFKNSPNFSPVIRTKDNKKELLVQIPSGAQELSYNIIW